MPVTRVSSRSISDLANRNTSTSRRTIVMRQAAASVVIAFTIAAFAANAAAPTTANGKKLAAQVDIATYQIW